MIETAYWSQPDGRLGWGKERDPVARGIRGEVQWRLLLRPQWRVVQIQAEDFVPWWMIVGRPDYYRSRAQAAQAAHG